MPLYEPKRDPKVYAIAAVFAIAVLFSILNFGFPRSALPPSLLPQHRVVEGFGAFIQ